MEYTILHNVNFVRGWKANGYEVGDALALGWSGEVPFDGEIDENLLEQIWIRHNRDQRPDRETCPSLSMGDVLLLNDNAYTVCGIGFRSVSVDEYDMTGLTVQEAIEYTNG
jgi:hypothetical protein